MGLIRALRDCKQRSSTVSKKAPTGSKKSFPQNRLGSWDKGKGDSGEFIRSCCWDSDFGDRRLRKVYLRQKSQKQRRTPERRSTKVNRGWGIQRWDPNLSGGYQNCGLGIHSWENRFFSNVWGSVSTSSVKKTAVIRPQKLQNASLDPGSRILCCFCSILVVKLTSLDRLLSQLVQFWSCIATLPALYRGRDQKNPEILVGKQKTMTMTIQNSPDRGESRKIRFSEFPGSGLKKI